MSLDFTAYQVIRQALLLLGVVDSRSTIEAGDLGDGLIALRSMLASWGEGDRLTVPAIVRRTFTLVPGQGTYTYGQYHVGRPDELLGDFNAPRPSQIVGAFVRALGSDYPVKIIGRAEMNSFVDKSVQGRPYLLYVRPTYPLAQVTLHTVPDAAYELLLDVWEPLADSAQTSQEMAFPGAYFEALAHNLAIRLAPAFGVNASAEVAAVARGSKRRLQMRNAAGDMQPTTITLYSGGDRHRDIYGGY